MMGGDCEDLAARVVQLRDFLRRPYDPISEEDMARHRRDVRTAEQELESVLQAGLAAECPDFPPAADDGLD